ncbi:Carboxylesterase family-domain-containing protein, partial [Russula dissimulans]
VGPHLALRRLNQSPCGVIRVGFNCPAAVLLPSAHRARSVLTYSPIRIRLPGAYKTGHTPYILRPTGAMRCIVVLFFVFVQVLSGSIVTNTTSGRLLGTQADGVASFKGIRFAHPPVGDLRWEPPVTFVSSGIQNATSLGPSCIQQIPSEIRVLLVGVYNASVSSENEDCLFLNVWAPAPISGPLKPVIVWLYGG